MWIATTFQQKKRFLRQPGLSHSLVEIPRGMFEQCSSRVSRSHLSQHHGFEGQVIDGRSSKKGRSSKNGRSSKVSPSCNLVTPTGPHPTVIFVMNQFRKHQFINSIQKTNLLKCQLFVLKSPFFPVNSPPLLRSPGDAAMFLAKLKALRQRSPSELLQLITSGTAPRLKRPTDPWGHGFLPWKPPWENQNQRG